MIRLPFLFLATACTTTTWEVAATEIPGGVMLAATTTGDEVLIAGGAYGESGTLWRYDGNSVCTEEGVADAALWWVHGTDSDWYAVGEQGVIVHELDGTRTREDLPVDDAFTLFGVYDDGDAVWAVGGDVTKGTGAIWRKTADTWEELATTPDVAFKVHEGWVVGVGFAWEWDGTEFVDRTPEGNPRLLTVRVRAADDVYVVGGLVQARFLRWNGSTWEEPTQVPQCIGQPLNGVYTEPGDDVWIAGNFGSFTNWTGTEFQCADFPITPEHFHAVWRFNDEVLAVGGNLFASTGHYGTIARYGRGASITVSGACP